EKAKGEEAVLAIAPNRLLAGKVVDSHTGQGVPNATLRVAAPDAMSGIFFADFDGGQADTDWKGRHGLGNSFTQTAFVYGSGVMDPLPGIQVKTDDQGRFRCQLGIAASYNLRITGPQGGAYLPKTQTVSWQRAATQQELTITLPRGVWVRGKVLETPSGKAISQARLDFWSKGFKMPQGVKFPPAVTTGVQGEFQTVLPPATWHVLANGPAGVHVYSKIDCEELLEPGQLTQIQSAKDASKQPGSKA